MKGITNIITLLTELVRHNLKIIFANKFPYFFLAAFLFFVLTVVNKLIENEGDITESTVYALLIFPSILLMFYPIVYGIQNDDDANMLEILFGVPNYRYKIWLTRFVMVLLVTAFNMLLLSTLAYYTLHQIRIWEMVYQLLFPVTFIASLALALSSKLSSGNGTAIAMVVIGLIFFIFSLPLINNEWNVFLNPFRNPQELNQMIWENIIFKNRLYLAAGSTLCVLYTLYNMQFRERFLS